jgi:hypothetical protein
MSPISMHTENQRDKEAYLRHCLPLASNFPYHQIPTTSKWAYSCSSNCTTLQNHPHPEGMRILTT